MGTSLPTPVRPVRMQKSTSEDLTYVPTDGFIGTDRLQAFVQSQRLQAASEQTQSAQLNMTIQVQLQEPRARLRHCGVCMVKKTPLKSSVWFSRWKVSPAGIV